MRFVICPHIIIRLCVICSVWKLVCVDYSPTYRLVSVLPVRVFWLTVSLFYDLTCFFPLEGRFFGFYLYFVAFSFTPLWVFVLFAIKFMLFYVLLAALGFFSLLTVTKTAVDLAAKISELNCYPWAETINVNRTLGLPQQHPTLATFQSPRCWNTTWQNSHRDKIMVWNTSGSGYFHGQVHTEPPFPKSHCHNQFCDCGIHWELISTSCLWSNIYRHSCRARLLPLLQVVCRKTVLATLASTSFWFLWCDEVWKSYHLNLGWFIHSFQKKAPPKGKGWKKSLILLFLWNIWVQFYVYRYS